MVGEFLVEIWKLSYPYYTLSVFCIYRVLYTQRNKILQREAQRRKQKKKKKRKDRLQTICPNRMDRRSLPAPWSTPLY